MANDWDEPTNSTAYATVLTELKERDTAAVKLDPTADSNLETGFLWYDNPNQLLKRWSGSAWVTTTLDTDSIAADAITGAKITDDAIDSEHYADGSIDTAHLADDSVTGPKMRLANNTWLNFNVAAGTEWGVIKIHSDDNVHLFSPASKPFVFCSGTDWLIKIDSTGVFPTEDKSIPCGLAAYRWTSVATGIVTGGAGTIDLTTDTNGSGGSITLSPYNVGGLSVYQDSGYTTLALTDMIVENIGTITANAVIVKVNGTNYGLPLYSIP